MRITFVLPQADLTGGIRVIATYAERLHSRGHAVTVVSLPHRRPTLREQMRRLVKGSPLPHAAQPQPSHLRGLDIEHRILETSRPITAADVPDADVVIATWWETAEWVMNFPASKGTKVYFVQHHEIFPGQPPARVEATYGMPIHKICVAQWLVELCRDCGDPTAELVPNAVDLEQFTAPPRGKQAIPTVGLMYSTASFKGCDISLKAFELARQAVPNLRLVAFGNSPPDQSLPVPADSQYTIQPEQSSLKEIYASADAWLFGSRSEGFGLPILEAMACRTPVIGTPTGAAPELLESGGGLLVPMENPRGMADAILKVCAMSGPEWRKLSDEAHAIASRYSWDDATDRFESALMRSLERPLRQQPLTVAV